MEQAFPMNYKYSFNWLTLLPGEMRWRISNM